MNSLHSFSLLRHASRKVVRNYSPESISTRHVSPIFSQLTTPGSASSSSSPSSSSPSSSSSSFSTSAYSSAKHVSHKIKIRVPPSKFKVPVKPPKTKSFKALKPKPSPPPITYHMYTDASSRGIGGYYYPLRKFPNLRYLSPSSIFSSSVKSPDQNKREAAAVLAGISRGIQMGHFVGNKVVIHCDNVAAVMAFSRGLEGETFGGGLKVPRVLTEERRRFDELVRNGRVIVVMKWIRGVENILADGLSRGKGLSPVRGW
jgi:hypothetical protein